MPDVQAFELAERAAEGLRQSAFAKAAAELKADKSASRYDTHNNAVHAAEVSTI
jgi:hypothetical protein